MRLSILIAEDSPVDRMLLSTIVGKQGHRVLTAADGQEDGLDRIGVLARDLQADGALAGDHIGVVERMHEGQAARDLDLPGLGLRVVERVAMQDDIAAQTPHGFDLDGRRRPRHHDGCGNTELARRQRDALGVIARRCADHAHPSLRVRQPDDLVVGAADLEREDRLKILPLQQHGSRQAL